MLTVSQYIVVYVHRMYTITTVTANFTYRETEAGGHELTCITSLRIFNQGLKLQNSYSHRYYTLGGFLIFTVRDTTETA